MGRILETLENRRIGLAMASGFFGFYHHAGALAAFEELGLNFVSVTGTSAGALVAAMHASGMNAASIRSVLLDVRRGDFWDMHWPWTRSGFGLLKGGRFMRKLEQVFPVKDFEDLSLPLSVGVYNLDEERPMYISSGNLALGVYASCAYPFLFTPAVINGKRYWDGGYAEKTPLIPFLEQKEIDTVIVSYLESSKKSGTGPKNRGLFPFISSAFAGDKYQQRHEHDRKQAEALRESGIEVHVLAPDRVWLGPFSLARAADAWEQGRSGMLELLTAG